MKNFVSEGTSIQIAAPVGGVIGGKPYKIGNLIAVALSDAAEGEQVTMMLKGSYRDLPKVAGTAFGQGDTLYFKADTVEFTKTASGNSFAGYAFEAADSAAITCTVLLSY